MSRQNDIKAETHRLILRSAGKLFRMKGVEKCTMRAVAREADVSPGTIMLHFRSKSALLEASISEDIQVVLDEALSTFPKRGSLLKKLMHIPSSMFRFYYSDIALYRALIKSTLFEPEDSNPLVTAQLDGHLSFIARIIEEERSAGLVRPDTDSQVAASSLASLYIGVLIHFFRMDNLSPEDAIRMLTAMMQQYLNGII